MVPASSRPLGKERRQEKQRAAEAAPALAAPPSRYSWVPLSFTLALVPIAFVERVRDHPVLVWSVFASVGTLLAWQAWLFLRMKEERITPAFSIVLRAQHYLQACLQLSVFGYWGWYWRPVYEHAWLLLAQLLFAYAFAILLAWSRRQPYALGFGVFPIVLSTNLFLWFRDDWFYLQFLMIAVGFLGKEFVRWNREDRRVHIFNPSAFSLGLFSVVLIAMNATDLTWGQEIASTLSMAPRIYTFLFVIGLIAMYNFSITLVSGLAAVVLFGWSAGYFTVNRSSLLHRFGDPQRRLPRALSTGDGPLHVAAHPPRKGGLWAPVRGQRLRSFRRTGRDRCTEVLRQAAGRPSPEPERPTDRPPRTHDPGHGVVGPHASRVASRPG